MSKASITTTPSPQGKLKRMQDNDVDLEAGISKKKILMTGSSSQQESQAQPTSQQATGEKPSFRVIGHFVMAMKRFQASINPTYTYGKVAEDSGASSASTSDFIHPAQRVLRKTDSQNGIGQERAMKKTFSSRGNKTSLLFKQLPDVPPET
ncbi:hypothetical protein ABBQ32_003169 [Trebouxia sp. C0010 RCD-2024]